MRIGIDLGGTKIEGVALDPGGVEIAKYRIDTPRDDYDATVGAIAGLVHKLEAVTGEQATVGAGIPGTVSHATGLVKNSNSLWLNGRPLQVDLSNALDREVRVANDANCLAVSEATDGAAAGKNVVFAVILGTGCGGGVSFAGGVHAGPNGIAGEWGHNPLPWATPSELPGPPCYCGKHGCMETWVSGTGVARDHAQVRHDRLALEGHFPPNEKPMTTKQIVAAATAGDAEAKATLARFEDRLARGLAHMIHILDPDVIVFGGGLSLIDGLYGRLPGLVEPHIFGGEFVTPLLPAKYGDASGVRGAAWLWPLAKR
ncbi:fructokinase [Granulicella pectinivorans]|uniref:Fructokinase n=1 Tax=Granulicella pectinivorans TaxID=474950 RepID=A0A1I6LIF5_9BACT|nr:ROK family protein [Granulicella pectinivorans]SFS03196.1 fructokinase [Granulicella pectinivorans]